MSLAAKRPLQDRQEGEGQGPNRLGREFWKGFTRSRIEALAAPILGALLYPLLAFLDRLASHIPYAPVFIEEGTKAAFLLGAAVYGAAFGAAFGAAVPGAFPQGASRRGEAARNGDPRRGARELERGRRRGLNRGLGLGLAAIAVFAAVESLAYVLAIPAGGIAGRLLWSGPVHLVAGLSEALGLGRLLAFITDRTAAMEASPKTSTKKSLTGALKAILAAPLGIGFGLAWHLSANILASGPVSGGVFAAVSAANLAALILLGILYSRSILIGGFTHE